MENLRKEELNELLNSDLMKTIRQEKAAALLARRTAAAEKIAALKAARDEALPRLQADLAEKEDRFRQAKAVADAAASQVQAAVNALRAEGIQADHYIGREEAILYETADPAIDAAIKLFRERHSYLMRPDLISVNVVDVSTNVFAWTKEITEASNRDAIVAAMKYCIEAIKTLESMKLAPCVDVEKIEALKENLPDWRNSTERKGTKPLSGQGMSPNHPLMIAADDSAHEYTMKKINERFQKIIKR